QYFRARNTKELEAIYHELDALEPIEQDPETYRPVRSMFQWPFGLALLLSFVLGLIIARPALRARRAALAQAEAT
ncbi:MAG: BatB protein, partial [Gammaproteobacteria bacterium]